MIHTINRLQKLEKLLLDIKIAVSMGDIKQIPDPLEQSIMVCKEAVFYAKSFRLAANATYGNVPQEPTYINLELLEALKYCLPKLHRQSTCKSDVNRMKELINKAEGN